jgi:type IV pilus assembly protein PilC
MRGTCWSRPNGRIPARRNACYEEELDAQLETLTSIIEPVLIVVIGGVIGAIVIALYLPLFDLITVVE